MMWTPHRNLTILACIFCLTGCDSCSFIPYDYETAEDAKLKLKRDDYSLRIKEKQLRLEKKIPIPMRNP